MVTDRTITACEGSNAPADCSEDHVSSVTCCIVTCLCPRSPFEAASKYVHRGMARGLDAHLEVFHLVSEETITDFGMVEPDQPWGNPGTHLSRASLELPIAP
jgi:hypothetical protein